MGMTRSEVIHTDLASPNTGPCLLRPSATTVLPVTPVPTPINHLAQARLRKTA